MAKPPAFQLYSSDFLTGTMLMSMAEVGLYIRLLCLQAEHGAIPDDVERIVQAFGEPARSLWPVVRSKFIQGEEAGTVVNERLSAVLAERSAFRKKQSIKGTISAQKRFNRGSTVVEPLEGRGRDRDITQSSGKERAREPEVIPAGVSAELWEAVKRWATYRKEARKPLTPSGREAILKKWNAIGDARAIAAIDHSIAQGWQGIYEPKKDDNGNAAKRPDQLTRDERRRMVLEEVAKYHHDNAPGGHGTG